MTTTRRHPSAFQTWLIVAMLACMAAVGVLFFPSPGSGQGTGYNAYRNFVSGSVTPDIGLQQNSLIKYHQLIWTVTGSPASCTVALDSSTDGVSWSAGGIITNQTCTTNGNSTITGLAQANYVRINVTALSAGGSLNVNYEGWAFNPSGAGNGTVTANNVVAGAMAIYPAAAASTTVSPDTAISSNNAGILTIGVAGAANSGSINYLGSASGNIQMGCTNATCTQWGGNNVINAGKYTTNGNCAAAGTAANPSVVTCAAATSGSVACNVAASAGTCQINSTQLTANSVVTIQQGNLGTGGTGRIGATTCNTVTVGGAFVSGITAGSNFVITLPVFTTNPMCFTYVIMD